MKDLADNLASYGRYGDSMLMHVQPREVAGLQALAEANGTSLTINPHTGLPEAFSLGNMLTSLLPTIVGAALAPSTGGASLGIPAAFQGAAPIVGGALTGAAMASMKGEDVLMGGVTGGLGGYGGGNLAGKIAGAGTAPAENALGTWQAQAANAPGTNELFPPPAPSTGALPSAPITDTSGVPVAPNFNVQPAGGGYVPGSDFTATTLAGTSTPQMTQFESGLQNVMNDPMKFVSENKMAVGMPLGGAVLAGLEPSDLGYKPPPGEEKFDPYATLNLSGSTGLKLFAGGGSITTGGLRDLYGTSDNTLAPMYTSDAVSKDGFGVGRLDALAERQEPGYAEGGLAAMASKKGGYLDGAGDGMSDSIPATIEGRQPARLADGEFVVPADVVSHLGNGSSKAGAKRLYAMLDKVRTARTGTKKQGKEINPSKYLPA